MTTLALVECAALALLIHSEQRLGSRAVIFNQDASVFYERLSSHAITIALAIPIASLGGWLLLKKLKQRPIHERGVLLFISAILLYGLLYAILNSTLRPSPIDTPRPRTELE